MMSLRLTPYFVMNGNAQEAIDFYERALGASVTFKQTFGDMPANPDYPLPDEAKSLIGHAMIRVGESDIMFSDAFGSDEVRSGNQVTICITLKEVEDAHRIFNALSDGGQIVTPLMDTDFSPAYGVITDKFGITFQFFTEGKM